MSEDRSYFERVAREEEDDINRKQGEFLLDLYDQALRQQQEDPVLKLMNEGLRLQQQHQEGEE